MSLSLQEAKALFKETVVANNGKKIIEMESKEYKFFCDLMRLALESKNPYNWSLVHASSYNGLGWMKISNNTIRVTADRRGKSYRNRYDSFRSRFVLPVAMMWKDNPQRAIELVEKHLA